MASFEPSSYVPVAFESVEIEVAAWRESNGQIRDVYRVSDADADRLSRVNGIHLVGATCQTEYGKRIAFVETLVRLIAVLRFHNLPVDTRLQ